MAENIVKQIKLPNDTTTYDVHDSRISDSIATGDSGKLLQVDSSGNIAASSITTTAINNKVTTTGTMTASHVVTSNGGTVIKDSGFTIAKSVPSDAKFTDTTYESKSAASGGTAVSLVTTGEKYNWNQNRPLVKNFTWPSSFTQSGVQYEADISSQFVGISHNAKIDLQLSPSQITLLQNGGCTSCVIGNNEGVVKLYLLGASVTGLGSTQVCITEVTNNT